MAVHRGRKSVAEIESGARLKLVAATRMKAPPGMAPAAQRVWRTTLASYPVDFFRPCDTTLLKVFCTAAVMVDQAAALIEREGLVVDNGRGRMVANPAVVVMGMATSMLNSTAAKLRIAPNARMRIDVSATKANAQPDSKRPWAT